MLRIGNPFGWSLFMVGAIACSQEPAQKASPAAAVARQPLTASQTQKLVAADPSDGDGFGNAVALSGNRAAIGSATDDVDGQGSDAGSAFVFLRSGDTWIQEAKVVAVDGRADDELGCAVALAGDTLVLGAHQRDIGSNADQGAAYVFQRNGSVWSQVQVLVAANGAQSNERFGSWLAFSNNTLAVGANGSVRIFTRSGGLFTEVQHIAAPSGLTGAGFGRVALSGDTLLVGAPLAGFGGQAEQGAAFKYTRVGSQFALTGVLSAPVTNPLERFGTAVALSGDTALIGTDPTAGFGAAYVFSFADGTIEQQARLVVDSDATSGDAFGSTVALSSDGNLALVGAPFHEHGGINANHGSVYLFARNGSAWSQTQELFPNDAQNNDHFGSALAVSGFALIGSPNDDDPFAAYGSAYAFLVEQVPSHQSCTNNEGCPGSEYCDSSGVCLPKKARGRQCEPRAGADCLVNGCDVCTSGHCSDGICCDSPCDAGCSACSSALTGAENGTCAALRSGTDPKDACAGPSEPGSCGPDGLCNGQGACRAATPAGTRCANPSCGDDGTVSDFACDGSGQCIESVLDCGNGGTGGTGTGGTGTGGTGTGGTGTGGTGTGGTGTGGSATTGGSGGSGGAGTGGSGTGGTVANGGTSGSGIGGSAGSGTAGSGGSGNPNACIRVAPDGDNAAALASNGATPFADVQPAIDFADSHRDVATTVCIAAGPDCGNLVEYDDFPDGVLRMRNGISVVGRYESDGWTRCPDSVTRLVTSAGVGVAFGPEIADPTTLEGVEIPIAEFSIAVVQLDGARGVRLVDITVPERSDLPPTTFAAGIDIQNGASVTILHSDVAAPPTTEGSTGIQIGFAEVTIEESSILARGAGAIGIQIQEAISARVVGNTIRSIGLGASSSFFSGAAIGIGFSTTNPQEQIIEDNDIEVTGTSLQNVIGIAALLPYLNSPDFQPSASVRVERNRVSVGGSGTSLGIWGTGATTLISNVVESVTDGEQHSAYGIVCERCVEILDNFSSAFVSATECVSIGCKKSSVGAEVRGGNGHTLVNGNEFRGGCGWRALGLSVRGSVRVQNNLLSGGECPAPNHLTKSLGITIVDDPSICTTGLCSPGVADVHSNLIEGGEGDACTSVGVELLGPAFQPTLRNNLVLPGGCAQAFNVDQTSPVAYATVLQSNDLAPGLPSARLYRIQGALNPNTIEEVNQLPNASGNFTVACPLPLVPFSPCADAGTPAGAPAYDFDGDPRNDGMPDVGPDELASAAP